MRSFAIHSVISIAFVLAPTLCLAADGAALYKAKCAHCHGAKGEGKPAMKSPAVKGTAESADDMQKRILGGVPGSKAPHAKGMSGLKPDQAKAIADYVKTL
jgi:mono/diheme cytochrome c family protein